MSGSGYGAGGRRIDPEVARRAVRAGQTAVPLETMIEEVVADGHPVVIMVRNEGGYSAQRNSYVEMNGEWCLDGGTALVGRGETIEEAVSALYRAWRKRE